MASEAIKPIYVLHGDDSFLRDAHRQEIIAEVIKDADPQLAITTFDADAELADVLDELRTVPFLAERRLVIIRDADPFVKSHRKPLEEYLNSPAATASLMLIVSKWDSKWRLARLVKKIGRYIDCSVSAKQSLVPWLEEAAAKRGKQISPDAAELLEGWIGKDRASLDAEIEKLSLFVGRRKQITIEDVSKLVTSTAGPSAYALTNAITAGDAVAALEALGGMLVIRGDEFKTLGMIAWHLRRALKAHRQIESGGKLDTRLPSSQVGPFREMLRRRGVGKLHEDFRKLLRADLAMKSGAEPTAALQELVVGLCS
ncbi:MAG: DNA polymerase III subunit delta [Planctomycetota bacterium]|jgi:DNA polymerase-3 subunit delta